MLKDEQNEQRKLSYNGYHRKADRRARPVSLRGRARHAGR